MVGVKVEIHQTFTFLFVNVFQLATLLERRTALSAF